MSLQGVCEMSMFLACACCSNVSAVRWFSGHSLICMSYEYWECKTDIYLCVVFCHSSSETSKSLGIFYWHTSLSSWWTCVDDQIVKSGNHRLMVRTNKLCQSAYTKNPSIEGRTAQKNDQFTTVVNRHHYNMWRHHSYAQYQQEQTYYHLHSPLAHWKNETPVGS